MIEVDIVLASASPRRRELLTQLGLVFRISPQDIDESVRHEEAALAYVQRMAEEKADAASEEKAIKGDTLIIGSDTIVVCGGEIMGKPVDSADAQRMLLRLSGQTHHVYSSVSIIKGAKREICLCESAVSFRQITAAEVSEYVATAEPMGKAGAYAIQGIGAMFVKKLNGSYSGVMGLPLFETALLLADFGIDCMGTKTEV